MNQYLRRKIWTLNRSGKFRGYLRTVSGYPVTLTDCMAGQPVSMAVDGNAIQDGTPTPDNPIDVQLCGDRTVNLFDKTLLKTATSTRGAGVGSTWEYDSNKIKMSTEKIYVKPNTQYTVIVYNNDIYWRDRIIESDANDICTCNHNHYTIDETYEPQKNLKVYTFVSKENTEYIIIRFMRTDCAEISYNDVTNVKCMLIEGAYTADTLPAYEPYGYKVSGRAEGLNLFNEKDFGAQTGVITNDDGSFTLPNISTFTYDIRVENNSIYTLKTISNNQEYVGNLLLRFLNENKQEVSQVYLYSNNSPYVLQTGNINYIRIAGTWSGIYTITFKNFQIVQGSYTAETMPPYEPYQPPQEFSVYLPEQIAKVGDVADEVVVDMEKRTAELRKNVGSMVVSDGYSGATSAVNTLLVRFYHVTKPARKVSANANVIDIAADIFEAETFNNLGSAFTSKQYAISGNAFTSVFNVTVPKTAIGGDTNELMNAWAAEHPATVYYPIATPITTDITALQDWDAMPSLWSGTAVITADTVIAPSAITAKYYASKPEEVN